MHTHFGERRSHVRTFETIQTDELRRRMERAIETMIATLDALDGDMDFEPANDDEPSLGWCREGRGVASGLTDDGSIEHAHGSDDREIDDCDDEDTHDREAVCEDEGATFDDEDGDNGIGDDGGRQEVESEITIAEGFRRDRANRRATIDPALMPDQYFVKGDGDCMDPIIKHGDRVLISKTEPIQPGDFVAIYFYRRHTKRGEHQILVKRLIGDGRDGSWKDQHGRPIVMVEMLNPHKLIGFPADHVEAIHRVVKVDNESPSYRLSDGEMLAEAAKRRSEARI